MINDTYVTVIGNVVADPRHIVTSSGAHLATFRLASTSRRFDRQEGGWRDGDTLYISVSCWRSLADNVAGSIEKGQPLIVTGRLRTRSYTNHEGHRRAVNEIEADAVGHNLARGVARFQKAHRPPARQPHTEDRPADPWTVPVTPGFQANPPDGEAAHAGDTREESPHSHLRGLSSTHGDDGLDAEQEPSAA